MGILRHHTNDDHEALIRSTSPTGGVVGQLIGHQVAVQHQCKPPSSSSAFISLPLSYCQHEQQWMDQQKQQLQMVAGKILIERALFIDRNNNKVIHDHSNQTTTTTTTTTLTPRELYHQALSIQESAVGFLHPDVVARTYHLLGWYEYNNNHTTAGPKHALAYFLRALRICHQLFGDDHVSTLHPRFGRS